MAVARDDLSRERIGLEPQPLARTPLDVGLDLRVRPDGAGQLADTVRFQRAQHPRAPAVELERPASELPAERRRLGVDPVRASPADPFPVPPPPPRATTASSPRSIPSTIRCPASWICSERAVSTTSDDVRP